MFLVSFPKPPPTIRILQQMYCQVWTFNNYFERNNRDSKTFFEIFYSSGPLTPIKKLRRVNFIMFKCLNYNILAVSFYKIINVITRKERTSRNFCLLITIFIDFFNLANL